jgi:uncharacterized sulfatase
MKARTLVLLVAPLAALAAPARPNFLILSWEDSSPQLGCYGDPIARTPAVDRLAASGIRYNHAYAVAGVCAPCRSTIVAARHAVALGSQHMRSDIQLPAGFRCFPSYLREAGYYCYNASKTDYNFTAPAGTWDQSGGPGRTWKDFPAGRPWLAVYNYSESHQGQAINPKNAAKLRTRLPPAAVVTPAQVTVPPYYPDTPAVRQLLADVYNNIAVTDLLIGQMLARLESDGLAEDTIVVFFADGGAGIARVKSHVYHQSLRVPLVVRIPAKFRTPSTPAAGSQVDELVSLLDLGPTLLSLAEIRPPAEWHGRAFLGAHRAPAPELLFGYRDRMNGAYLTERAVLDQRWHYVRSFRPDREPHPVMRGHEDDPALIDARRLHREGKFTGPGAAWLEATTAPEQLYDVQADPHCVNNLARDPRHRDLVLQRRAALRAWQVQIRDLGLLPESQQLQLAAAAGAAPAIPAAAVARLPDLALAWERGENGVAELTTALTSGSAAERYWAVAGLGQLQRPEHRVALRARLHDEDSAVALTAVWMLYRQEGADAAGLEVLRRALRQGSYADRLEALQTARRMGPAARSLEADVERLRTLKAANMLEGYFATAAQFTLTALSGR